MTLYYTYQPPIQAELDLLYNRELSAMCRERGLNYSGNRTELMERLNLWRPRPAFVTPRQFIERRTPPRETYTPAPCKLDKERAEREGNTPEEVAELKEKFVNLDQQEKNCYRMVFQQRDTPEDWPELGPADDIYGEVRRARPLSTIQYLERLANHYDRVIDVDDRGEQKAGAIRTAIYQLDQMNDPHSPNVKPVGGRCIPEGGWLWKTIVLWSPWKLYDLDRFVPDETLHLHWNAHSRRGAKPRTKPEPKNAAKFVEEDE